MLNNQFVQAMQEYADEQVLHRELQARQKEYLALAQAGDFDTLNSRLTFTQIVMDLENPYVWKGIVAEMQGAR